MDKTNYHTEIITRYFSDSASYEEIDEMLDWLSRSSENQKIYQQLFELWIAEKSRSSIKDSLKKKSWEDICHQIPEFSGNSRVKRIPSKKQTLTHLRKIAATGAIIVGLGISYLYFTNTRLIFDKMEIRERKTFTGETGYLILSDKFSFPLPKEMLIITYLNDRILIKTEDNVLYQSIDRNISKSIGRELHQLYVPNGHVYKLVMEDNTTISLNSGSSLLFRPVTVFKNREVELDGEAYFDVTYNKRRSFVLKADEIEISVLGTEFNVISYKEDDYIETTLVSGSIGLRSNKDNASFNPIILKPNDRAFFSKSNNKLTVTRDFDTETSTSWVKNYYKFDSESIYNVLKKIAKNYGYNLKINNNALYHFHYSGKLERLDSIKEILDGLKLSAPIKYKISDKTIILDYDDSKKK